MAVTRIWPIKGRLRNVIDYAMESDKTEKQFYVTGVNCTANFAREQMVNTKRLFKKEDGILAFHGYQSFKPGEVTAELAHEIGIKLAEKLWGDRFEVVVSTHLDKHHLHNHFCQGENEFFVSVIELLSPFIHRKPPGKNPRRQAVMFAYLILTLLTALHAE